MPTNNIKLFDENKVNMLTDVEYNTNAQRINGVQSGVASSKLQNKTLYQTSLISYAIAQFMNEMGFDASDSGAVSTFVNNLSSSIKKPADSDVKYISQTLTDAQKTQARVNIAAAPNGYGLGGTAKVLTAADDLNNIKTTGWYCYHNNNRPANVPTPALYSAVMEVIHGIYSDQTAQRVYSTGDDNDWNLVLQRVFYSGWQPWEWINPPMKLGVEYRTTERYMGNPVYVKLIDCGNLPDGTTKDVAHGITNLGFIVGAQAIASDGTSGFNGHSYMPSFYDGSFTARWANYLAGVDSNNISIFCGGGLAGCPVYVTFKYTKTTD